MVSSIWTTITSVSGAKIILRPARATGFNWTPFAAFFLRGNISVRWTQFKCRNRGEKLTPITWIEFKAFLRKNLRKSKSFVNSIWRKLKKDSQY